MINDKWLNDSVVHTTFTLDALAAGKVNTGDTITGATSGATAVVSVVDTAARTITVDPPTGTFQNGEVIVVKSTLANAKLFLKFNAAGAVSDMQSADPGFVAMTGAGPYKLTFPATLPSGNAPDVDLPAGVTITTEVEAGNTSSAVTKTSNIVTPA
jgi:hypothetical protein